MVVQDFTESLVMEGFAGDIGLGDSAPTMKLEITGGAFDEVDYSFLDGNLSLLNRELTKDHTIQQLQGLLGYEHSHQSRVGAISKIELAIEKLQNE